MPRAQEEAGRRQATLTPPLLSPLKRPLAGALCGRGRRLGGGARARRGSLAFLQIAETRIGGLSVHMERFPTDLHTWIPKGTANVLRPALADGRGFVGSGHWVNAVL